MTGSNSNKMKRNIWFSLIVITISLLIPILAWNSVLKPESEFVNIWFQRSGSLMTIFALIADVLIVNIHQLLYPSGYVDVDFDEFKKKYYPVYIVLTVIAVALTISGTLVWGYGDLIVNLK